MTAMDAAQAPTHEAAGAADQRWRFVRSLFLAFLALWLLFTLFPLYFMAITAFKSAAETNLTVPTFWPQEWFPSNFAGVFAEPTNFDALVDSFVIATGKMIPVRAFCELSFAAVDLDYEDFVEIDPRYYRPAEVEQLLGDPTKAREKLGWTPTTTVEELARMMVESRCAMTTAVRPRRISCILFKMLPSDCASKADVASSKINNRGSW